MTNPRFKVFATPSPAQPPFDISADVLSMEWAYGADGYSDPSRIGLLPLTGSIQLVNQDGRYSPGGAKPTQSLELTGVRHSGQTYATSAATDSLYTIDATGVPTRVGRLRTTANQRLVFPHSMVWHNNTLYVVDEFDRRFYSVNVDDATCTATSVVLGAGAAPRASISVDGVLYAARGTLHRIDISAGTATNMGELQLTGGGTPLGEGERLAIVTAMGEHAGTVYAAARLDNPSSPRQAYAFGIVDVSAVTFTWLANFPAQTEIGALSDLSYVSGTTPEFVAWRFIDGWFWPINLSVSPPSFGSDRNGQQRITGATIARTEELVEETVDLWFTDEELTRPISVSVDLGDVHLLESVPARWDEGARGIGGHIDAAIAFTSPLAGALVSRREVSGFLTDIISDLLPSPAIGGLGGHRVTLGTLAGNLPQVVSELALAGGGYALAKPDGIVDLQTVAHLGTVGVHATLSEAGVSTSNLFTEHGYQRVINEILVRRRVETSFGDVVALNPPAFSPASRSFAPGATGVFDQSVVLEIPDWSEGEEIEYIAITLTSSNAQIVPQFDNFEPGVNFGQVRVRYHVIARTESGATITFSNLRVRRRPSGDQGSESFGDDVSIQRWGRRSLDLQYLEFANIGDFNGHVARLAQVHQFARIQFPLWQDTEEAQQLIEGLRPGQVVKTVFPASRYEKAKAVILSVRYLARDRKLPTLTLDLLDLLD